MTEVPSNHVCPRCASVVTEPFYGPCAACRSELRATCVAGEVVAGGGADRAHSRFEPKMNVVPNQVATKD